MLILAKEKYPESADITLERYEDYVQNLSCLVPFPFSDWVDWSGFIYEHWRYDEYEIILCQPGEEPCWLEDAEGNPRQLMENCPDWLWIVRL